MGYAVQFIWSQIGKLANCRAVGLHRNTTTAANNYHALKTAKVSSLVYRTARKLVILL